MQNKTIIVTGANSGIGKVAARELAKMGATIVMVCRSEQRGAVALADVKESSGSNNVHLMICDLSSQRSIREFAAEFLEKYDKLDVLINNAGAYFQTRQESIDGIEQTFALNHMGYFLLTNLLLDLLKASAPARIVNVASGAHYRAVGDFENYQRTETYSGFGVYCESKLANVMHTYELARRIEGTDVTVNSLHPGFVRTAFGRNNGRIIAAIMSVITRFAAINEDDGAKTTVYLASSPEVEGVSGKYFDEMKEKRSSKLSTDLAAQQQLWQMSENLLK